MNERNINAVIFFFISALLFLIFSCSHCEVTDDLESVLILAGDNRSNLESVLIHYSRKKKDSLKYQAACYLILNMPGHCGIYHHNTNLPDAIYENIEKTLRSGEIPSFPRNHDHEDFSGNQYKKYDIEIITSGFLISHIESAFYAFENFPWCKNLSFDEFKTYILPYRCDKEPLMDLRRFFIDYYKWISDSMDGCEDMARAYTLINNNFYFKKNQEESWEYGKMQNMYDIVRLNKGLCEHETILKTTIMRSLGIVCTYDEISHWANRNGNHAWTAFIDKNNIPLIIDGRDSLYKQPYLHFNL